MTTLECRVRSAILSCTTIVRVCLFFPMTPKTVWRKAILFVLENNVLGYAINFFVRDEINLKISWLLGV